MRVISLSMIKRKELLRATARVGLGKAKNSRLLEGPDQRKPRKAYGNYLCTIGSSLTVLLQDPYRFCFKGFNPNKEGLA